MNRLSPKARTLLEHALSGESDAVKARVLHLVLDAGINPEEEFFLLSLGLNHVKVLLYDAPQQLDTWSKTLHEKLEAWTSSHVHVLQAIAQKSEATSVLTDTAGQLATMLTAHTQTCNALIKQLQASHHAWGDSWEQQDEVNAETLIALKTLSDKVDHQALLLQKLAVEVKAARQPDPLIALGLRRHGWQQASFYIVIGTVIFAALVLGTFAMPYVQSGSSIQFQEQYPDKEVPK